ncbi:MAG: helix-turn-helix domain-containing protein [Bacteroidota bacterium]
MNYSYLKLEIEKSEFTFEQLANKIGMSSAGLHKAFRNRSMKISTLENICQELKMNPASFWMDKDIYQVSEPPADYGTYKEKYLYALEKIERMHEKIDKLKDENAKLKLDLERLQHNGDDNEKRKTG